MRNPLEEAMRSLISMLAVLLFVGTIFFTVCIIVAIFMGYSC